MLLMVEKEIRRRTCHAIYRYVASNNKHMKKYKKEKESESSYLMYLDANILYGWALPQKLPVYKFKWKKYI